MKKIKLFLVTLLSVVGVMDASAQEVSYFDSPHTQIVDELNGYRDFTLTWATWRSNESYDYEGNTLNFSDDATNGNDAIGFDSNGNLYIQCLKNNNITISAPQGWLITGFRFKVVGAAGASISYDSNSYGNNEVCEDSGLEVSSVALRIIRGFNIGLYGHLSLEDFEVYLKRLVPNPADERLNEVTGVYDGKRYWEWVQENPVKKGNFYKVVNYTKDGDNLQIVGQNTNTIINNIEDAGEWLFADDGTITIVSGSDPAPKPIYDGYLSSQRTTFNTLPVANGSFLRGYQIQGVLIFYLNSNNSVMYHEESALSRPTSDNTVWNFYSMDQYYCYEDYKSAYEAFMGITDVNPDYADEYNALKAEVDGYTARGNTEENRDAAYAMIQKMLDVVAILGGKVEPGMPLNFDAENAVSMEHWRVRRVAEKGEDTWAVTDAEAKLNGNKGFDIRNCTMSQSIRNLEPGIYKVSVWWQAGRTNNDNASVNVVLNAASNADNQSVTLIGEGVKWQQAEIEVVVVDGRLTISATANTGAVGGWVNLDDFALTYVTKNRVSTDATKTTVYQGVFDDSDNIAVVTKENPYADITAAYGAYFKFDNTQNLNGLCYAKNGKVVKVFGDITKDACNVVRDGKCANLVLKNGYPYSTKKAFTAADAKYDMTSFGVGVDNAGENITFGTMILPYAVGSIPSDVKVYSATSVSEDGNLTLSQVSSVEANIPYLVEYTGSANPLFEAYSTNKPIGIESVGQLHQEDMLVGAYQLTEVENDGTNYLLQKQNGKLAFYRVTSAGLNVGPFRCYLHVPSAVNAPSKINIVFDDEVTGITEVEDADCADVVYDIQGRRVENAVRPGIYVKNGKKYLVK